MVVVNRCCLGAAKDIVVKYTQIVNFVLGLGVQSAIRAALAGELSCSSLLWDFVCVQDRNIRGH